MSETGDVSESNVERARRGYEAVRRGDLETIREFLDPEVKWHGGNPEDPTACHNRKEALAFLGRARTRVLGDLVDVIGAGDKVVVIMRRRGDDGELELIANLTTFRAGKAVEMVHYPDPADARAAAGL